MQSNSTTARASGKPGKPHLTTALTTAPANASGKPSKPYPEYPLTPHPSGRWCKKVRGQLVYFGRLDDPDGALEKYLTQKDDLHAGRKPRPDADALTIKELVNAFLTSTAAPRAAGDVPPRTWDD